MAAPKSRSVFDLPPDFFDSCRLLHSRSGTSSLRPPPPLPVSGDAPPEEPEVGGGEAEIASKATGERGREAASRWTCNTCRAEFESLQDQRAHFKSDIHRLNVKLIIAGKDTIKEEDFGELDGDSLLEDLDVSSISGSEDELENESISEKGREGFKQKVYFRLHLGEIVSLWRCLLLDESEDHLLENNQSNDMGSAGCPSSKEEGELINRLKALVCGPRDKSHIRIVLLVSGGHFAGCVFDGKSVIAHKTFHRYVVRAKAGKKQSAKDGTGKTAHSAGSSLRRYNEAALKMEIQELLISWKPYIDLSECIFIYAPSKNRQMLFDVEKPQLSAQRHVIRYVPFTVHRPTLKEVQRIYNLLTYMTYEVEEKASPDEESPSQFCIDDESIHQPNKPQLVKEVEIKESSCQSSLHNLPNNEVPSLPTDKNEETPLHEAAKSGDAQRTMELLEQGLNPCIRDARGRTPYMLASEKEVRNTFRRFMALNLDKWDWHAANVPSPLTKEMEESQAAKQAEKDAKRKAKAKELKKLQKAKEKAKAQAASSQNSSSTLSREQRAVPKSVREQPPPSNEAVIISKEEEQKRALAVEREKRAAAAERRIAALNVRSTSMRAAPQSCSVPVNGAGSSELKSGASDSTCSCCNASLAGKVPFHRYHYKYCSTSCMHVHREILEDG